MQGEADDSRRDVREVLLVEDNLIDAQLVVQYRIGDLHDYLFATEDPQLLIEQVVRATLVEAFASTPGDDVLTSAKASLQNRVRHESQARLDQHGAGITLVAVSLQSVNPPREAAAAFRAVSDARAEAAKAVNSAEGERDKSLRLTRGEADRTLTESHSTADTRQQRAQGAAKRFEALLARAGLYAKLWNVQTGEHPRERSAAVHLR